MKRPLYYLLCAIACTSMVSSTMPMATVAEAIQPQAAAGQQAQADATSSDTGKAEDGTNTNAAADTAEDSTATSTGTSAVNTESADGTTAATGTPAPSLRAQTNGTPEAISVAAETGYAHSATASQNGVTLTLGWNDVVAGEPTTFHLSATGGSSTYKFRMDAPFYMNPGEGYFGEMVADTSRGQWMTWTSSKTGCDYEFTMTASGRYYYRFYLQDAQSSVWSLRVAAEIEVSNDAHPSVNQIITNAVDLCRQETNGSEYDMALWLHDWTLDQLEYDHSLNWCSAESGLTRHQGTCESYQRIYSKLLDAAGIANGRITGNGHTWNAVKIDGKWCQMDLTWDDTSDNWYGDLDQRHLYFGLTDELMAIAHSDHTANYQKADYAYRSTDLSNNYFVRNGKADEWAEKYADRIQQNLDVREESFSIDTDNQSFPPSISGIQNGIVAYAMNQRERSTGVERAKIKVESNTIYVSANSWTSVFIAKVSYQKPSTNKPYSPILDGLDYSSVFDAGYYLANNPDVKATYGEKPARAFEHFADYGMNEGRRGSESFDVHAWRASHPELEPELGNDLKSWYRRYLSGGRSETFILDGLDYSSVFDAGYYLANNPDVKATYGEKPARAFEHFAGYGMNEGRRGSESFDVHAWRASHPELEPELGDDLKSWYRRYLS